MITDQKSVLEIIFKFLKFGVVGTSGIAVDFGITFLLKEKAGANKYLANTIGFISAASSNYALNRMWTFHSQNPRVLSEYSSFVLISVIGILINNAVIWILVSRYRRNFYLSKLVAIGVTFFWNFFANFVYTFSNIV